MKCCAPINLKKFLYVDIKAKSELKKEISLESLRFHIRVVRLTYVYFAFDTQSEFSFLQF